MEIAALEAGPSKFSAGSHLVSMVVDLVISKVVISLKIQAAGDQLSTSQLVLRSGIRHVLLLCGEPNNLHLLHAFASEGRLRC